MKQSEIEDEAKIGMAPSQMMLGHCHLIGKTIDGNPMPIDYEQAKYWLEAAHSRGVGTAAFLLGTMYEDALGVEQDIPTAIDFYAEAAENEHIYAILHLARIYANGKGVPVNEEGARYCYSELLELEEKTESSIHEQEIRAMYSEARSYLKKNG